MHLLPLETRDPFGRPILVLRAADVASAAQRESTVSLREVLPVVFERLRLLLTELNAKSQDEEPSPEPTLQYTILVDLKGISLQNLVGFYSKATYIILFSQFRFQNIEALTWVVKEIIPKFPGMLATVFMINYSWMHSGVWNVVKFVQPIIHLATGSN